MRKLFQDVQTYILKVVGARTPCSSVRVGCRAMAVAMLAVVLCVDMLVFMSSAQAMAVDMLAMTLLSVAMLVTTSTAQDSPRNVAVNKTASQSSTFDGTDHYANPPLTYRASAGLAVDGAPTKSYLDKTCAVTDYIRSPYCTNNPWWQVDLGGLYDVFNVTIYQRGERETGKENFGPLVMHIGKHVERPENRTIYNDRPVVSVPLSPPVTASTVNISILGCGILQLCEVEIFAVRHVDKCASNPCQHGGTCADGLFNYTCICESGYTGVSCATDINECHSSPCQYGATCRDLVGRFECGCLPGYSGTRCERDIDECASSPCQHGNCADRVNSYSCTCLPGYTGLNCSQDVDECASNPCRRGATCHDYLNFYNCMCTAGFTGQNCETNVDDCASSPCPQNSLCVDGVNSYSCHCATGYTGLKCNQPCSGGTFGPGCSGTCSPHCLESSDRGSQHCDHVAGQCLLQTGCKDGFQGSTCSTKQQPCPAAAPDRYAEGVGTGLGVGLGTSLLLALGIFALLRCRSRGHSSSEGASVGGFPMSSRQIEAATLQQRNVSEGHESRNYEILDDATKDRGPLSPYSELGDIRKIQNTQSPYSN